MPEGRGDTRPFSPARRRWTLDFYRPFPPPTLENCSIPSLQDAPPIHDAPVWTENKRVEKLRYIHRNP
jgi:hypothetical protein